MATGLFDGDDCPNEGGFGLCEVLGEGEVTKVLDEADGSIATVEDAGILTGIPEGDDVVASDVDIDVGSFFISGLKRAPMLVLGSVKFPALQQLLEASESNTLDWQQKFGEKVPGTVGQGNILL